MKQALGLIEVIGLSNAVIVADTMAKAANVEIIDVENSKGSGYMTVKIAGDVGAVSAAVMAGKEIAIGTNSLVGSKVIPRPTEYVEKAFMTKKEVIAEETTNLKIEDKHEESKQVEVVKEAKKDVIEEIKEEVIQVVEEVEEVEEVVEVIQEEIKLEEVIQEEIIQEEIIQEEIIQEEIIQEEIIQEEVLEKETKPKVKDEKKAKEKPKADNKKYTNKKKK